jgi:hypothetical protein
MNECLPLTRSLLTLSRSKMSFSLIDFVANAGYQADLPTTLKKKVKPTNVIALVLMFAIALPFIVISLIYFPELTIIPFSGMLTCIGVITANSFGGIKYSRLFLSILPVTQGALYNAYLSNGAETPIPCIYLIELSFSLVPFVVFDLREKGFLWFTSLYSIALISGFPITKHWLSLETDDTILRDGWLGEVSTMLGVITGLSCMVGLAYLHLQASNESENLLLEAEEKSTTLEKSQQNLQETVKQLEVAQENERKRNWVTEGITKINDIFRTQSNSTEVFDKVIAQLIRYLNANQGGLYVVHGKSEENVNQKITIQLAACYAYSRKKYLEKSFEVGEGLIGQCYLEEDVIYLTDVPANYVRITSGLGEATPTSLLLMPLKENEVVEGIVEIASFQPLEPHEIEFVAKAGENIASYIQAHRINERTARLLEDTQEQAEMMRAQEEEMRQNMEELAATQEEMHRKEQEYIRQIEELKQMIALEKGN